MVAAADLLRRARSAIAVLRRSEERLDQALTEGLLSQLDAADRLACYRDDESADEMARRLVAWARCQAAADSYRTLLQRRYAWPGPCL